MYTCYQLQTQLFSFQNHCTDILAPYNKSFKKHITDLNNYNLHGNIHAMISLHFTMNFQDIKHDH